MYSGYNASAAVVAQVPRSRSSSCPSNGLLPTDPSPDSVAHEVAVHGLYINPRFLLYNYYLRQSSLIYWSPARTLISVRRPCLSRYSRLALLDRGGFGLSCSPLRFAREERCGHGCCCCGCRSSSSNFGEEVIELLAGGGGFRHGDIDFHFPNSRRECCNDDYDRFEHPRESWRKEVEIRDGNRKKERYSRSMTGGSGRTCHSCGSNHRGSRRRRSRGYEVVDSFEDCDDAVSDISTEMEYRRRDDNVKASSSRRAPQREGRHKEGGHASSSYRLREYYDSEVEDMIEHRKKREGSQRIADIHEDYVEKTSRCNSVVASSIMDREKGLTLSVKQHREGGQHREDEKRETKGALSRISDHSMREEYGYDKQNVVGQRDSKEGSSQKLVRLVDVYEDEDDGRRSSSLNKFGKSKFQREESSLLTTKQHNQVDQEVIRRADLRTHHREEHVSDEDRLLRQRKTREGSHKSTRISKANENDVTKMSSLLTAKQHNQVDQELVKRADLRIHHREEHVSDEDRLLRQRETREGSHKSTRISKANENDVARISRINNIIDSRKVDREELLTSTLKQHSEIDERASGRSQSRPNLQKHSDIIEVDNQKLESTSNTRRRYEKARLNNKNDNYTSVKVAIDDRTHVDEQVIDTLEWNKQYGSHHISGSNVSNEIASSSQSLLEMRLDDRKDHSTSTFGLTHESMVKENLTDRKSTQESSSRRETKGYSTASQLSSLGDNKALNTEVVYNTRVKNDRSGNKFSSTRKSEVYAKRFDFSNDGRKNNFDAEVISNRQRETLKESSQLIGNELPLIVTSDDQTNSGRMVIKGDMLDSATQIERSSAIYIREFVDKARQEPSSSQIHKNKGEEIHPGSTDASCATITSGDAVTGHSLEEHARISSFQSKTERQLYEMWDASSPTSQETLKMEPPQEETSSPGILDNKISLPVTDSVNTHSSPMSLWSLLTCITRMGWSHHDESHASTGKSGKKSSSADSVSSEAWFPGQELDDSENGTDNRGSSTSKGPLLINEPVDVSHSKPSSSFGQTSSETKVKGQMIMSEGATVSTSMDILQGGSVSIGVPLSMTQGGSFSTGTPSMGMIQDGSGSTVSPTGFRPEGNLRTEIGKGTGSMLSSETPSGKSPVINGASLITAQEAITSGDVPLPACGVTKMEENLITEESPESKKIEGKEGELKRRKLQRSQQVLKERFEAWEEACRIETEQRKIDEHFMREALAEAQKAADAWEVPVGAVLVHDGKIIARGFNLVEELRDSTVHAEMICIREASNILRTWRLAGTTLYVTLEPCPMCAGAILQARVDTVVWGAPNKLLGADGSWVRLFPGGEGGSSGLDPSNQLAGPIHPFHSKIIIRRGVLATECSEVMQQFFKLRRKEEKKQESTPPSCQPMPTYPIKFFTKMNPLFSILFCLY